MSRQPSPQAPFDVFSHSLTILRTDTVFAKLPIHNLAKGRLLSIQIASSNEQGSQDLYWQVSPSTAYGPPQQLAYKLDTLLINRHLDALQRPLPTIIRLGSLREICEELGLRIGKSIAEIKHAFHQNAGAYITAKLCYRDTTGKQRRLEAGFNRYGVVFTGESLPNGVSADAVYIVLNESYRQVLNAAPTRPVDYDYLSYLKPLAQRFYELLSFKMYAALKYQRPCVTMRYSELCLFAPQRQYGTRTQMTKQMYKIHRPHLQSGYLAGVEIEPVMDADGNPDWLLHYTPGPKAQADYHAFTGPTRIAKQSPRVADGEGETKTSPAAGVCWELPGTSHAEAQTSCEAALVRQFYRNIFDLPGQTPHPRELDHAHQLISNHGWGFATFFVDFACRSARRSNFSVSVFGGLMRYERRALVAYRRQRDRQAKASVDSAHTRELQLREQYEQSCLAKLAVYRSGLSRETLASLEDQVRLDLADGEEIPRSVFGARLKAELHDRLLTLADVPSYEDWLSQKKGT